MNILNNELKIKINPREFVRKLLKVTFIFLINYLLLNTLNLNLSVKIKILTINVIIFCLVDILFPSINVNDNKNEILDINSQLSYLQISLHIISC